MALSRNSIRPISRPRRRRQVLGWTALTAIIILGIYNIYKGLTLLISHKTQDDHRLFWLPDRDENSVGVRQSSFQFITDSLPSAVIEGTEFPRGIRERSYMGVGVWNARMSLPRALMAMMGSKSSYVETPLFTVCRLQLQFGNDSDALNAALRRELFPTSDMRRDWFGYYKFIHEIETTVNCSRPDNRVVLDEESAARMAQSIIDSRFSNQSMLEYRAWSHAKYLNRDPVEEPSDLIYTTVYPYVAAQYYGPSIVVLSPDRRGLDLGYFTAVKKNATCHKEDPADGGEMITPGYKLPSTVVGFEIRREGSAGDAIRLENLLPRRMSGKEVPSITHAFYRESIKDNGDAIFILNFHPGTVHCIKSTYNSDHRPGSFFECASGGHEPKEGRCVMGRDDGNYTERPLRVAGMAFSESFRGQCKPAESVLQNLPSAHQGFGNDTSFLYSQTFQNVMATVFSKLGREVFIAHYSLNGKVVCEKIAMGESTSSLWQSHREVASSHIGLDTQYTTCIAELPPSDTSGVFENAKVIERIQSNPLERDVFTDQVIEHSRLTDLPNYLMFIGNNSEADTSACFGFKGSVCLLDISSNSSHVQHQCRMECSFTRSWFASLDDPPECHSLARAMISPIVNGLESIKFQIIGRAKNILKRSGGTADNLMGICQSEIDPIHWPLKYKGSINIVSSADVHGYVHGKCTQSFCSSGASSFSSVLETIRLSSSISRDPVLVLDGGDALFGSGVEPKEIIATMNDLGYDAMALGNHDLDIGVTEFSRQFHNAEFPIIAANANVKGVQLERSLVKDLSLGGEFVRVCITEVTTPEQNPLAGPDGLTFPHKNIDQLARELIANKDDLNCELQILLSHLGFSQDESLSKLLATSLSVRKRVLDLIIGGHTHLVLASGLGKSHVLDDGDSGILMEPYPTIRVGIPIAHAGSNNMYVGILRLSREKPPNGVQVQGDLRALNLEEGVFPDQRFLRVPVRRHNAMPIFVNTTAPVCSIACRKEECLLGNFAANAMRECILDSSCGGLGSSNISNPLIALLESGTIRGCLKNGQNDLSEMLPWPNKLVVMTLNGTSIRAMLQHGLNTKYVLQGGGYLQTSGLVYKYRANRVLAVWQHDPMAELLKGKKTLSTNMTVTFDFDNMKATRLNQDNVIRDGNMYNIVVTDWLAAGGDGFSPILKEVVGEAQYTNTTLQEALLFYTFKGPTIKRDMRSFDSDDTASGSMLRAAAAMLGSLIASICTYPVFTMSVLRATSTEQGHGVLDGVLIAALASAFSNAIFFFFFHLNVVEFQSSFAQSVFAAVVNVILTNPLWVVVTRIQTAKSKSSFFFIVKTILKKEGPKGFFDGVSMNMMMIAYPSIRHWGLEVMNIFLAKHLGTAPIVQGFFASVASCFATVVTYPIQRWRLQLQVGGKCTISGSFDGVGFKILHSGLTNFILFATMSQSEQLIDYVLTE